TRGSRIDELPRCQARASYTTREAVAPHKRGAPDRRTKKTGEPEGMEDAAGSAAGMTAGVPSGALEVELENVCRELGLVNAKVSELLDTQSSLQARRDRLSKEIQARKKRRVLPQRDWGGDDFEWSKRMNELLRGTFGLNSWRTNQKEIVNATLSGRDAFVVMRTGGGKSLCYQLPALLKGGITVVVSPLISLIEDQTRYLNDLVPGSAAMLSAGMDKRETNEVYRRMRGDDANDSRDND
ncbi:unnamed protein product, partial [Scytosiphon promiscuus]